MSNKNALQEYCQKHHLAIPKYELYRRAGPDHAPQFWSKIFLGGGKEHVGSKACSTRKDADQLVAKEVLLQIKRGQLVLDSSSPGVFHTEFISDSQPPMHHKVGHGRPDDGYGGGSALGADPPPYHPPSEYDPFDDNASVSSGGTHRTHRSGGGGAGAGSGYDRRHGGLPRRDGGGPYVGDDPHERAPHRGGPSQRDYDMRDRYDRDAAYRDRELYPRDPRDPHRERDSYRDRYDARDPHAGWGPADPDHVRRSDARGGYDAGPSRAYDDDPGYGYRAAGGRGMGGPASRPQDPPRARRPRVQHRGGGDDEYDEDDEDHDRRRSEEEEMTSVSEDESDEEEEEEEEEEDDDDEPDTGAGVAGSKTVVVVTGCSGRIGRAVCQAFLDAGCIVRGLDICPPPVFLTRSRNFEYVKGSTTEVRLLVKLLNGRTGGRGGAASAGPAKVIVHMAAVPDDADFDKYLQPYNITGVHNVFEACRKGSHLSRVVMASSGKIFVGRSGSTGPFKLNDVPQPRCMYAATKLFCEAAAQAYAHSLGGLPTVVLRFAWCPRHADEVQIMRQNTLIGEGADEFLSPGDAASCVLASALNPLPEDTKYAVLFCQSKVRPGRQPRFDISETTRLLGWTPQDTFPAGIDDIIASGEYKPFYRLKPRTPLARPPQAAPTAASAGATAATVVTTASPAASSAAVPALAPSSAAAAALEHERVLNTLPADGSVKARVPMAEWAVREELAAAYRVFANLGWTHLIHTHITVKVPSEDEDLDADPTLGLSPARSSSSSSSLDHHPPEQFLLNPYGLTFSEITASSLIKVDATGTILDGGSTTLGINPAGFKIHSAIHTSARGQRGGDVLWTMHTHTPETVAVASTPRGLIRGLSQYAMDLGPISYHDFEHATTAGSDVCARLVRDLGPRNKVLLLRNHGCITVGKTVHEAFFRMFQLIRACEVQVKTLAMASALATEQAHPLWTKASDETVEATFRIISDNYTGHPFGFLEWKAAVRDMEREFGTKYKN